MNGKSWISNLQRRIRTDDEPHFADTADDFYGAQSFRLLAANDSWFGVTDREESAPGGGKYP
jgi:hypothetical protein